MGKNRSGQLGEGTYYDIGEPKRVEDLKNIVSISAGSDHCFALDKNGRVFAWGSNKFGQLGCKGIDKTNKPI